MESDRNTRGPLIFAALGASLLVGGIALLRGKSRETGDLRAETASRAAQVIAGPNDPVDSGVLDGNFVSSYPPVTFLRVPENNFLTQARNGDREAAAEIVRLVIENDQQGREGHGTIGSRKIGISWEEFTTYRVAGEALRALDSLNNPQDNEGYEDDGPDLSPDFALWDFYRFTAFQASTNGPYDPLFLKLIGLDAGELRDRIEEAVIYTESHLDIFPAMIRPRPEELTETRRLFGIGNLDP